jgi:hypothetical protein
VAITANTTYVASYHSQSGYFAIDHSFFAAGGVNNAPLHALQSGVDGPNGVCKYGASGFPSGGGSNNYWVDVVFRTSVGPDTTPPAVTATSPSNGATGIALSANITATFSESINPATLSAQTFRVRGPSGAAVPAPLTYNAATRTAVLDSTAGLAPQTAYTATVSGGTGGVADLAGNMLAADVTWSFTTGDPVAAQPNEGPGGPILVISSTANPFSRYLAEIVRAEGLNAYTATDIALVTPAILASVDARFSVRWR